MRPSLELTSRFKDGQSSNDGLVLPSFPRLRMLGIQFMRSVGPDIHRRSIPKKLQKDQEVHKEQKTSQGGH